ncbi:MULTISPECIES: hypothetical protein [Pectobacterium]|uniref:hypothetical protein n=1 Tax=Pectobacterium TaxID=122277 RepID=UPI00200C3E4F|nr:MULTISPECIES: hypothetical protein [Pectobacterium]UPY96715.1 hypothetical protein MYB54_08485 [Pectobacterium sp. 21LCBS03]WJM81159.1 hypothetical protein QTI90_23615 [Pectobacterium brasiliense]
MEITDSELTQKWNNLLFDVRRSVRYHNRRRAFYDRLDQISNMLTVMLGSTAIYGMLSESSKTVALIGLGLVTGLSAINLVLASSQRARMHFDLARRFVELEKLMIKAASSEEMLAEFIETRLTIEMDEPPVLRVLDALCYNEQVRSMGYPDSQLAKIGWLQRQLAPFVDWNSDKMKPPTQ